MKFKVVYESTIISKKTVSITIDGEYITLKTFDVGEFIRTYMQDDDVYIRDIYIKNINCDRLILAYFVHMIEIINSHIVNMYYINQSYVKVSLQNSTAKNVWIDISDRIMLKADESSIVKNLSCYKRKFHGNVYTYLRMVVL